MRGNGGGGGGLRGRVQDLEALTRVRKTAVPDTGILDWIYGASWVDIECHRWMEIWLSLSPYRRVSERLQLSQVTSEMGSFKRSSDQHTSTG